MDFKPMTEYLNSLVPRDVVGLGCRIYVKNALVFEHYAGFADREKGVFIAPDTRYNLYSASKVATCAAAMQLCERGVIALDDPISRYLPEFESMTVALHPNDAPRPAARPITVRHLMTMTAGLTYQMDTPQLGRMLAQTGGQATTRQIAQAIAQTPLAFDPGDHWNYSLCHDVLAALIEAASGQRFGAYLKQHLFDPIGMSETGFDLPAQAQGKLAMQYRYLEASDEFVPAGYAIAHRLGANHESGGAGLISTVRDYALFLRTLANWGQTPDGARVLQPETIALWRTPQLGARQQAEFNWPQLKGFTYGLGVRTLPEGNGEFGWDGAAGAFVLIDPERQTAMFYAQHIFGSRKPRIQSQLRQKLMQCL